LNYYEDGRGKVCIDMIDNYSSIVSRKLGKAESPGKETSFQGQRRGRLYIGDI
jgi:hypothetical protein